jgi:hypothetical protein
MTKLLFALTLLLVPTLVLAGQPTPGTYTSTDIGGLMLTGRFSESFVGGGPGQLGNTIHAQSFDGAVLGTQWSLSCVSIAAPPVVQSDTRDANGTGFVTYVTDYDEGEFVLEANGPWGDGSQDYTGVVVTFQNTSSHQYFENQLIAVVSNVNIFGTFDGFADCMEFVISNSATLGSAPDPKPADYPEFMDPSCGFPPLFGAWGDVPSITLTITGDCAVDGETSSFGTLKSRW